MSEVQAAVFEKLDVESSFSYSVRVDVHCNTASEAHSLLNRLLAAVKDTAPSMETVLAKADGPIQKDTPVVVSKPGFVKEAEVTKPSVPSFPVPTVVETKAPLLPTPVVKGDPRLKVNVPAPAPAQEEPPPPKRTGYLRDRPVPAAVVSARDFVPVVSWLRAQGYDSLDDITTVCLSTFRYEVTLLDETPNEFMKELVAQAMVALGMLEGPKAETSVQVPEVSVPGGYDHLLTPEAMALATLRELVQYIVEKQFPGQRPSPEELTDVCVKIHNRVPVLKACSLDALPRRIRTMHPALFGPPVKA